MIPEAGAAAYPEAEAARLGGRGGQARWLGRPGPVAEAATPGGWGGRSRRPGGRDGAS